MSPAQWIIVGIGMLSFLGGASAQLTQLFGPSVAADVASVTALLAGLLTVPLTVLTGQSAQVRGISAIAQTPAGQAAVLKAVEDMPGVQDVKVNRQANPTLAAAAVDPNHAKVTAVASDQDAIRKIASNG